MLLATSLEIINFMTCSLHFYDVVFILNQVFHWKKKLPFLLM